MGAIPAIERPCNTLEQPPNRERNAGASGIPVTGMDYFAFAK